MKKQVTWIYKLGTRINSAVVSGWGAVFHRPEATESTLSPSGKKAKSSLLVKAVWAVLIIAVLVGFYAVIGFYALPALLTKKLPDIVLAQTGRQSSIRQIEFQPFSFFASLHDFKLLEKSGKTFVSFDKFSVKLNVQESIKQKAVVIDDVALVKPYVSFSRDNKGVFNFDDILKLNQKKDESASESSMIPFNLIKFSLSDGNVKWEDKHFGKAVSEEIKPLNFEINNLSFKAKSSSDLAIKLALKSGGTFEWKGKVGLNPIFSEGNFLLDEVPLQTILALALSDTAGFDLQGHGQLGVDYYITESNGDLNVNLKKSRLALQNFVFTDKSTIKNVLKIPTFLVEADANVSYGKDKLAVTVKKTQLQGKDIKYSNDMAEPIFVAVPEFNHKTDITVSQSKAGLTVSAVNAQLNIKNLQFNGLKEQMVEVKVPAIDLNTAYQIGLKDNVFDVATNKGKLTLHNVQLDELNQEKTLVNVPVFELTGIGMDLNKRAVVIDNLSSKGALIESWLTKAGTINFLDLVNQSFDAPSTTQTVKAPKQSVAAKTSATNSSSTAPDKDWLVKVTKGDIQNYGINFEDKTLDNPKKITVQPINIKVNNFTSRLNDKLPFQIDIGFNKTGSVNLKGNTVISPLAADVNVDIKKIDLDTVQPYIDKFAKIEIIDGRFNTQGRLLLKQVTNKPLDIKYSGVAGVDEFVTRDRIISKDLVKWDKLTLSDLNLDIAANRFTADTLKLEKPYARVTIRKDKTVNFSDLIINEKEPIKTGDKPSKVVESKSVSSKSLFFNLDKLLIVDGASDFADLSLLLPFAAHINSLKGGAQGISSVQKSSIKVDLNGSAYDLAPVTVNGEVSPYLSKFNVNVTFKGLPMPLVTPYMVQFAGYKIEKGKLNLGLHYEVENQNLKASNSILIDQLELGDKVENPDAVSLPLKLAVSLLKDSDGKIKLDVPLTGSLQDPQFSISHLVVDTLVNVLTKVAAAPFKALGSLFSGGSEENLNNIVFKPGAFGLDDPEKIKLDGVAKALKQKTDLSLEVKGAVFELQDWPALQDDALFDQLKERKANELSKKEGKRIRAEYVELSDSDYKDMLAEAFIEKFPSLAEKSMFGKPKLTYSETRDFYDVAKQTMQVSIQIDKERLKGLANDRSQAVAKYLVQKGGIPNERVFILDSVIDPPREGKEIVSMMTLKAD